jgi:small conductance mechanosensitive channel
MNDTATAMTTIDPLAQGTQSIKEGVVMVQKMGETAVEFIVKYGFQVLGGIIILFIGWKIAGWAARLFVKFGEKKHFDVTLTKFLANIIRTIVMVFVFLMAIEKFGVTIAPMVAAASALIFGTSFALQAPLSNYAAGLMVILTRPFVVGNTIQVQGVGGVVEEVKLPATVLVTEDGERITIPNKEIVGQILYNSAANKVVELTLGVAIDDPERAIETIRRALRTQPQVVKSPEPQIGIDSFGDSSIVIGLRYWVPTAQFFQSKYAVNLAILNALKAAKISLPFPHVVSITKKEDA